MKTIFKKSNERGTSDLGWLKSAHSFSFSNYFDPKNMSFGSLRVLNDDRVAPQMGFGKHPHENMEIISIPLKGSLKHKDTMGNEGIIKEGDVQVMSAGTGIQHSEANASETKEVHFLQIWIIPNKKNVEPSYAQKSIDSDKLLNRFEKLVSPYSDKEGLSIYQDAWLHLGHFDQKMTQEYLLNQKSNGVFIFVLEGQAKVGSFHLERRDALGVWDWESIEVDCDENSKILLIEVPMS